MRLFIDKFCEDDARRAKASGDEESVSEMDTLLADMALGIEEASREALGRREAAAARQERLEEEGSAIKSAAVEKSREGAEGEQAGVEQEEEGEREERSGNEGSDRWRKRRRRDASKSYDGEEAMDRIESIEEKRREVEMKRIELEERRFEKEFEDREEDKKERKERAELDKEEKLALINLFGSMADSFKSK